MESMNHVSQPPTVAQEKADRLAQRDTIAALFRLSPLQDIEPETLRKVTANYHQRVSECRTELGMYLQNQRRSRQDADGTVHRLPGAYKFFPEGKPLGRDAGTLVGQIWPSEHPAPCEPEFRLTAPD